MLTIAAATSCPLPPSPPSRRLALSSTQTLAALRTRHFALLHSTFALHARLYGEEEPATAAPLDAARCDGPGGAGTRAEHSDDANSFTLWGILRK